VQVVDRFHLVVNLREALETFFLAHPTALKQASANTAQAVAKRDEPAPITARSKSSFGAQSSFMGSSVRSSVQSPLPPSDSLDL